MGYELNASQRMPPTDTMSGGIFILIWRSCFTKKPRLVLLSHLLSLQKCALFLVCQEVLTGAALTKTTAALVNLSAWSLQVERFVWIWKGKQGVRDNESFHAVKCLLTCISPVQVAFSSSECC
jgi:hypothetical protein